MALSTVSQPLPDTDHLLLTKQLICFFSLCVAVGVFWLRSDIGHGLGLNIGV